MKDLYETANAIVDRGIGMSNIKVMVSNEQEIFQYASGYKQALLDVLHDVIDIAYSNGREDD